MLIGYRPSYDDPTEISPTPPPRSRLPGSVIATPARSPDEPAVQELMRNIAADENHHFIFYKAVMQAMLDPAPGLVLGGIHRVLDNFQMPGGISYA